MDDFTRDLSAEYARIAKGMRKAVRREDKAVNEKPGAYMNANAALVYTQGGVDKYVIAKTARGLTFHSMVMYSNTEITKFARERLAGIRLQKGCFNITAPDKFDLGAFDEFLRLSAQQDFQPVIDHYANRAKRKKTKPAAKGRA